MFGTLYKDPSTIAKYRRAPHLKERENADRLVLRRLRQTDPEVRLEHQGLLQRVLRWVSHRKRLSPVGPALRTMPQ